MKTKSLRAVFFDFDGVLADTEPIHLAMFQKVLAEEGVSLSESEYDDKYLGLDDRACFEAIYRDRGLDLSSDKEDDLVRRKHAALLTHVEGKALFLPGVQELLERVHLKYYLAVVSGALKGEVLAVLKAASLDQKFQVILGAEDVPQGKPDPAGYLLAVRLLNRDFVPSSEILLPEECLVIEDSPWGIEAAQRAGMKCLAVMTSYPKEKLGGADLVIPNLRVLKWEAVEELFQSP